MKKILCAILAAVLTLSIFASCTGKKPGGESGSSEPTSTLSGPDTSDIVKGEILGGRFYLGMTKADFFKALADNNMETHDSDGNYGDDDDFDIYPEEIWYYSEDLIFVFDKNDVISSITMTMRYGYLQTAAAAATGMKCGDSLETVKTLYGEGSYVTGYAENLHSYKFGNNYLLIKIVDGKVADWQISKTEELKEID